MSPNTALLFPCSLLLASCASTYDVARVNTSFYELREVLAGMEHNIQTLREQLDNDLKRFQQETRNDLYSIEQKLSATQGIVDNIKAKTDQFEVKRSNNSLLLVPTYDNEPSLESNIESE